MVRDQTFNLFQVPRTYLQYCRQRLLCAMCIRVSFFKPPILCRTGIPTTTVLPMQKMLILNSGYCRGCVCMNRVEHFSANVTPDV